LRDSDSLEVDIVVRCRDGRWGAFAVKLGGDQAVEDGAANLLKFANKVDTEKVGEPSVLGVITATGYGYARPDTRRSRPDRFARTLIPRSRSRAAA
jgi:hypothetical protein